MRCFQSTVVFTGVLALAGWWGGGLRGQETYEFERYASWNGDVNADETRDVSDAIAILGWLYAGAPPPAPLACELQAPDADNGDANADGTRDVSDVIYLLGWLFGGGPEPFSACGLPITGEGGHFGHHLRIISPRATFQGRTYGEWSAQWWRWAINQPADGHPFFEESACAQGQRGPVWFLTGNFGDPIQRECTVPAGKAILFPILNAECSTVEPPPFFGSNEPELRQCAEDFMAPATDLEASLDGREVRNLGRFRMQSPLLGINYPANNILGVPGPGSALSVSDGYWILIAPPREGTYTIHFAGVFPFAPLDMTYTIHVVDESDPRVVPVDNRVAGKTYGDWGFAWWEYVLGVPFDESPVVPGASGCVPDQTGPVHFLFGNFGGVSDRSCTVPAGKYLFFPLLNSINDYPCPDPAFAPAPGQTLEDFLTAGIDPTFSNPAIELGAELDGVPIPNLRSYRATSRLDTFTGDISQQAIDPCITGEPQAGVADGYWLMLKPLSPGMHTLHFTSAMDFFGTPFSLDVTYHLTVKRGK
jgi:hypothetical protein